MKSPRPGGCESEGETGPSENLYETAGARREAPYGMAAFARQEHRGGGRSQRTQI